MKILIFTHFVFNISLVSCHYAANKKAQSLPKENSIVYTVPLFYMLIHVCRDGNLIFRKASLPTHLGKTYIGRNLAIVQKENIFYDNAANFLGLVRGNQTASGYLRNVQFYIL